MDLFSTVMLMILLILVIIFLSFAVLLQDLLKSAVFLALGSLSLTGVFFLLESPFAAVFELSVGAGLITVLILVTISLTKNHGVEDEEEEVQEYE
ncbi:MAG: hypothetical protein QW728_03945 [Thermoplasmata archaeon]